MSSYVVPSIVKPEPVSSNEVVLVASGDLRESANQACWAAQAKMEADVVAAFERKGIKIRRAHPVDAQRQHGLNSS